MPTREWTISLVNRTLDDWVQVVEPLLIPEICCCDGKIARLRTTVRELARQILERLPARDLHQRILPGTAEVERLHVELEPPKRAVDWVEPVELEFDVVKWTHGYEAHLAYVPVLAIQIIARRQADLPKMLGEHIIAALRRSKASASLFQLALTQRESGLALEPITLTAQHKSPRQIASDLEDDSEEARKLVINEVGLVLGEQPLPQAFELEAVVEQLADLLTGRLPRSVLLVGASGVGKTAAVHELVRHRAAVALESTPVWSTSGSRLIAGMSGYGMWQQRCQRLCKQAAREHAIMHMGNLIELMQVGRFGGSQGIAGFLKSPIGKGEILAIAECTPEQLAVIEQQDPHLLELFHQLRIEEPAADVGLRVLRHVAQALADAKILRDPQWLQTLDRLHRRFASYSAAPGRPVRFLRNLLKDRAEDKPLDSAQVIAAFSRETGLPLAMLDPQIPLDLAEARAWFASRLIGQERAIDLIVDLLATVKASLTRPRRPIASLLFVGPTGVGKTEMAKALAEYFFGDRNRLTRFDMSEFASPAAVERLIGGPWGEEGLLTAKVREQPFTVLLFDEFEKAHGGFFDLLLQVLGDGRLTDAAGRLADFSNAIVIMTSNLGAESFNRGAFGLTRGEGFTDPQSHFTEEVRTFIRPELFNRIDRVIPFLPLDAQSILRIADRELLLVEQRDGFRVRGLSMDVSPAARQQLAERGYDIRYGARPLKRAIERQLLAPLAEAINQYPADIQLQAQATLEKGNLAVDVRAKVDATGKAASMAAAQSSAAGAAEAFAILRRDVQRLAACPAVLAVTNQLFQFERAQRRKEAKRKAKSKPLYDETQATRIRELRQILDAVHSLSKDVNLSEDQALAEVYSLEVSNAPPFHEVLVPLQERLDDLLLQLLARQRSKPHRVLLGAFGQQTALVPLMAAYHAHAIARQYEVGLCWYDIHSRSAFRRHRVEDPLKLLESPESRLIGIALIIEGPYAWLRFGPEAGTHILSSKGKKFRCLVEASDESMTDYSPPPPENWPTEQTTANPRRGYDTDAGIAKDSVLARELRWSGRTLEVVVSDAIELQLHQAARSLIEG